MYVRLLYFPSISKSKLFVDLVAYRSGFNVLDKPEWGRLFRRLKLSGIHYVRLFFCILMGPPFQKLQNPTVLSREKFFLLQMSTNALQVTSVTAVRHVTIQMAPTRAHVTAASRGMDEPVEVRAFE